jgi:hypothetical protein
MSYTEGIDYPVGGTPPPKPNHSLRKPSRNYVIHRPGDERDLEDVTVTVHELHKQYWLDPKRSLAVRSHSPTGFNFGYGGSGPAQLALAILLDFTDDVRVAQRWYQTFKFEFLSGMKHPGGIILGDDIQTWLDKKEEVRENSLDE